MASHREHYLAAARAVVDQVGRLPADVWDAPGLGDWSVRTLVGHLGSMMTSVVDGTAGKPDTLGLDRTSGYYAFRHGLDPAVYEAALVAVAEVHAADAEALGDDPKATLRRQLADATAALDAVGDDDLVAAPVGGMRLRDWLPTRTLELAVHGMDLEAATGVPVDLPPGVLDAALAVVTGTAVELGHGRDLLRALTGRGDLPAGYSAL